MGNTNEVTEETLVMYSKLINMGYPDDISLKAAYKYQSNIDKAVDWILHEQKTHISDDYNIRNEYEEIKQEAAIDPNQIQLIPIYESPNANDDIIKCIGRLNIEYSDQKLKLFEKSGGTGTIIHIDEHRRCYVLTAAHNCRQALRQCISCKKNTVIRTKCQCKHSTKVVEPVQMIQANNIHFSIRCITKNQFGYPIRVYPIIIDKCYVRDIWYNLYHKPTQGYDIAVMIFQCKDEEEVKTYESLCEKITLKPDAELGGQDNELFIYGYPEKKYGMYGMSTGMKNNNFQIEKNEDTRKYYIINNKIDTLPGQSGSVIWSYAKANNKKYEIYGIHTGGLKASKHKGRQFGQNYGTFLDKDHINWIEEVKGLLSIETFLKRESSDKYDMFQRILCRQKQEQQKVFVILQQEKDSWDSNSIVRHRIMVDKNIIISKGGSDTIFLNRAVSEGKHSWDFRILEHTEGNDIFIGVWKCMYGVKIPKQGYHNCILGEKANQAYVYDGGKAKLNQLEKDKGWLHGKYGEVLKKNDIVSMCIDFDLRSLSYKINGKECGTAFLHIENCEYKAAVSLFEKGDRVQLLSFV
eukprot:60511_1